MKRIMEKSGKRIKVEKDTIAKVEYEDDDGSRGVMIESEKKGTLFHITKKT